MESKEVAYLRTYDMCDDWTFVNMHQVSKRVNAFNGGPE